MRSPWSASDDKPPERTVAGLEWKRSRGCSHQVVERSGGGGGSSSGHCDGERQPVCRARIPLREGARGRGQTVCRARVPEGGGGRRHGDRDVRGFAFYSRAWGRLGRGPRRAAHPQEPSAGSGEGPWGLSCRRGGRKLCRARLTVWPPGRPAWVHIPAPPPASLCNLGKAAGPPLSPVEETMHLPTGLLWSLSDAVCSRSHRIWAVAQTGWLWWLPGPGPVPGRKQWQPLGRERRV